MHKWTDAERQSVGGKWLAGDSAGDIAADMPGASRQAVMGVINRMGLMKAQRGVSLNDMGIPNDTQKWQKLASAIIRTRMKECGVTQVELCARLRNIGIDEPSKNISSKLLRGTFSATFLLQVLYVLSEEMPGNMSSR